MKRLILVLVGAAALGAVFAMSRASQTTSASRWLPKNPPNFERRVPTNVNRAPFQGLHPGSAARNRAR